MIPLDKCYEYEPPITRLTKANSTTVGSRVIYIVKKGNDGKALKVYCAYDYKSKKLLAANWDKDFLITFLQHREKEIKETFNE